MSRRFKSRRDPDSESRMMRRHYVRAHLRRGTDGVRAHQRGSVDTREQHLYPSPRFPHADIWHADEFAAYLNRHDAQQDETVAGNRTLEDAADLYAKADQQIRYAGYERKAMQLARHEGRTRDEYGHSDAAEVHDANAERFRSEAAAIERHRARKYNEVFE
jgi:hypothetical protein